MNNITTKRKVELYIQTKTLVNRKLKKEKGKALRSGIVNYVYENTNAETMREYLEVGMIILHVLSNLGKKPENKKQIDDLRIN